MPKFIFVEHCKSELCYEVLADTLAEAKEKYNRGESELDNEPVLENWLKEITDQDDNVLEVVHAQDDA